MKGLSPGAIERELLPFREARRLILTKLLGRIGQGAGIAEPFLLISRLFCRLKSADSILEKIARKGIAIEDASEIPRRITDVLGFRVIVEDGDELDAIDQFLMGTFEIDSRSCHIQEPGEFGERELQYRLKLHEGGTVYPFEVQLRTFFQHLWARGSFHLFHKRPRETALEHREALLSLSDVLQHAERLARDLRATRQELRSEPAGDLTGLQLVHCVNLIVVEPGERFADHVVVHLSGDDRDDHERIVDRKVALYGDFPDAAIVECSCMNFSSFVLNEPHVRVPAARIERIVS